MTSILIVANQKIAPLALRAAKQAISRAEDLALEIGASCIHALSANPRSLLIVRLGLDFERASYDPLLSSKDRTEALEAFKQKRRPVFKGE